MAVSILLIVLVLPCISPIRSVVRAESLPRCPDEGIADVSRRDR